MKMAIATENGVPPARLQVPRIPVEAGCFERGNVDAIDFEIQPLARRLEYGHEDRPPRFQVERVSSASCS